MEGWLYNMGWVVDNLIRLKVDNDIIIRRSAGVVISTYCQYLEFIHDKDERIDANKLLEWVKVFVKDYYNKYPPTKEILNEMYQQQAASKGLVENIPEITLREYIKLAGGKEC